RRRHTSFSRDWSSDVCSSDLLAANMRPRQEPEARPVLGEYGGTPPAAAAHGASRRAAPLPTPGVPWIPPGGPRDVPGGGAAVGLLSRLGRSLMDGMVDSMMQRMLTEPYPENVFAMVPILNKVHVMNVVETGMRAAQGKPLSRPLGSPIVLSDWNKILINPVHLCRMPTPDDVTIDTSVVIGPRARRPLKLDIPILITGMSYGGALSLEVKLALARGASMAGTAANTGEAPLLPEERQEARWLIGQYNRGGWLNEDDDLAQLDAIEIQLGQGAQAAAPQTTPEWMIGPDYREAYRLRPGQDARIRTRLPGVDSPRDFIRL